MLICPEVPATADWIVDTSVGDTTGTEVAVFAGLGRAMYAQRFSCVAVGAGKMAALAGKTLREKKTALIQAISRTSSKTGIRQECLVEEEELMALNWE